MSDIEFAKPVNRCPISYVHLPHDYCDGTPAESRGFVDDTEPFDLSRSLEPAILKARGVE